MGLFESIPWWMSPHTGIFYLTTRFNVVVFCLDTEEETERKERNDENYYFFLFENLFREVFSNLKNQVNMI